ncbi:MAG TPA: amidohydrolase family protein [Bryobacteraceae bacterium]|nr:amidohydrolase family protein [Bryobacteraceae bacterium]
MTYRWTCLLLATAVAAQTWITDVTIVSPERLDRIEKGSVLIDGDRIVRVQRGSTPIPRGAKVISGKGQYLIPGLIDSHVHLASVPGVSYETSFGPAARSQAMIREYFRQLPRSYLYFGYTTLVDLAVIDRGVLNDFRAAPQHPDLYDCGASLPVANGYPMSFAPPESRFRLFPNFIYDPKQASSIPAEFSPRDHTPAADVARVRESGGICVKTYFERGFGADRNLPVISAEAAAEVRRAATAAGLVLMMHANSFEAQKFAVDANVDVIAHGMWIWGDLERERELPPEIRVLLDRIAQKRIGYQPTIQVMQGLRAYFDPAYLKMKQIPSVIPADMLAWFNSADGKWFKKEIAFRDTPDAAMSQAFEGGPLRRVRQTVEYLAARNANFVFGTDTPSAPTYGNLPGLNGYLEMHELQKAGLSLEQIFRAATISNAREFRLDGQVGTIEPGKIANLVLLSRSPLESVEAYDSVVMVWVHGKAVMRAALSAASGQ